MTRNWRRPWVHEYHTPMSWLYIRLDPPTNYDYKWIALTMCDLARFSASHEVSSVLSQPVTPLSRALSYNTESVVSKVVKEAISIYH
jgi:hypothetical protein